MQSNNLSLTERLSDRFLAWLWESRLPFFSSLVFGLLAHAFIITNKLPNHDDVAYLFSKGETVRSGRWGLELLRFVIPDYSMPWLHGIVSLLLISFSICIIVHLFRLRSRLGVVLLSALIICFPSQIGTFCYMYTSSCYAVAFLLSVLAVREAAQDGWKHWVCSVLLIVLMASIYQAYISITSSLLVLLLIQKLLQADHDTPVLPVLKRGILYVAILLVGFEIYRLSINLSLALIGSTVNQYSNEAQSMAPKFPEGFLVAYRFFAFNLTSRYNMIIVSKASRLVHFIFLFLALIGIIWSQIRAKNLRASLLLLFCLIVLPLSICCLYIVFYWNTIHTLVLYSFFTLYLLAVLAVEAIPQPTVRVIRDLLYTAFAVILGINICFANRCYLKLFLEYENAYSLATILVTQIRSLPGYEPDDLVVIYPSGGAALHFAPEFGTQEEAEHDLMGIQVQLLTGYTEEDFISRFVGAEMNIASHEQAVREITDRDFERMPVYPAEGSVARVEDGLVFVKMAEPPES
ncbi:MAG: glucosyltransferase domain-containing protein [Oscillospiraceae bacterium]|nr:glucosyltransferase domain-containing protein [Oscillospiraceae bacterium]